MKYHSPHFGLGQYYRIISGDQIIRFERGSEYIISEFKVTEMCRVCRIPNWGGYDYHPILGMSLRAIRDLLINKAIEIDFSSREEELEFLDFPRLIEREE